MNSPKSVNTHPPLNKVGIFGGTFDPIHYGHIKPAIEAADWLSLDKCYLLPAHIPPHKQTTMANVEQRKAMVDIVCKQFPLFTLDQREILKDTASYSVESLQAISEENKNSQIFFMVGMDSLLTFTTWYRWQDILNYCHLVVNVRPPYNLSELSSKNYQLLSHYFVKSLTDVSHLKAGKIIFHQQEAINISSTEIRENIAKGHFEDNKIPDKVIQYIKQQQLYR